MYTTLAGRDAEATYRQIDLAGRTTAADGAALVQLLYDEAIRALRAAACAAERRQFAVKGEKVTRATAILFALEANLDFDRGGEVSRTLAQFYAGCRRRIVEASVGTAPAPFREVADSLAEIAGAWQVARAA